MPRSWVHGNPWQGRSKHPHQIPPKSYRVYSDISKPKQVYFLPPYTVPAVCRHYRDFTVGKAPDIRSFTRGYGFSTLPSVLFYGSCDLAGICESFGGNFRTVQSEVLHSWCDTLRGPVTARIQFWREKISTRDWALYKTSTLPLSYLPDE